MLWRTLYIICGALRDFLIFVQFRKREKHQWRSVNFSWRLQPATLLKLTLLHGCFSRFSNSTNGTKSSNAPHMMVFFILNPFVPNVP